MFMNHLTTVYLKAQKNIVPKNYFSETIPQIYLIIFVG